MLLLGAQTSRTNANKVTKVVSLLDKEQDQGVSAVTGHYPLPITQFPDIGRARTGLDTEHIKPPTKLLRYDTVVGRSVSPFVRN